MICHLTDSFRLPAGEKSASSVENILTRTAVQWLALWLPRPWPHGTKPIPEVDQQFGGTPPPDFGADQQELVSLTVGFAGHPAFLAVARHPFFREMSVEQWMRWAYLHMDHHLRQFNC
jgi:hypothetical protein